MSDRHFYAVILIAAVVGTVFALLDFPLWTVVVLMLVVSLLIQFGPELPPTDRGSA